MKTTMNPSRRDFVKLSGLAGASLAGNGLVGRYASAQDKKGWSRKVITDKVATILQDGEILETPFMRVESGRDGPSLLIMAAQHGNEVIGAEVALRFQDICARQLQTGTVWLLPMANLLAIRSRRHSFDLAPEQNNRIHPTKPNNMQRTWPGNPQGNNTERIAYTLDQEILRHCSHLVDIHCYQRLHAAETLGVIDHEPSRPMVEATTTRFFNYFFTSVIPAEKMLVSQLMLKHGGSFIGMELSGQFEIPERQVQIGVSSMVNIAKRLNMLAGEPEPAQGPRVLRTRNNTQAVKAPDTGLFVSAIDKKKIRSLAPEDYVEKGQSLGHIIRERDLKPVPIVAPVSGYLFSYGPCHWGLCDASLPAQHPYTDEGETLASIVTT